MQCFDDLARWRAAARRRAPRGGGGDGRRRRRRAWDDADGDAPDDGDVVVMAATNLPEAIDAAFAARPLRLRRTKPPARARSLLFPPSRGCSTAERAALSRSLAAKVFTPPPTTAERAQILARRRARAPPGAWAADVDVDALARASAGFSGADLVALCQSAAARACATRTRAPTTQPARRPRLARAPHMTAAHFERALRDARPSTSAAELRRFEAWAAAHRTSRGRGRTHSAVICNRLLLGHAPGWPLSGDEKPTERHRVPDLRGIKRLEHRRGPACGSRRGRRRSARSALRSSRRARVSGPARDPPAHEDLAPVVPLAPRDRPARAPQPVRDDVTAVAVAAAAAQHAALLEKEFHAHVLAVRRDAGEGAADLGGGARRLRRRSQARPLELPSLGRLLKVGARFTRRAFPPFFRRPGALAVRALAEEAERVGGEDPRLKPTTREPSATSSSGALTS